MNISSLLPAMALVLAFPVLAAGNAPPHASNAEMAAHKACAEQAGADANGRPNFAVMDSCMKAKGFEKTVGDKPDGPPPK